MGMDGISIANTGMVNEQTSADKAARTEQAMNSEQANSSQQVQETSNNQRVKEKEDEEQSPKRNNPQDEVFQDGLVEEPEDTGTTDYEIEDFDNPNKEFYVKLNVKDDIIELYDSTNDRLIETISGSELGELVQKLNMASGIFVNKKV